MLDAASDRDKKRAMPKLEDDILLAAHLADTAGNAIRPLFRGDWDSERKADRTYVTEADRAAEAAMRTILEAERPDDGIVGEEYGTHNENAGRQWVLDPIDGTQSFMAGRPIFGTLIALCQDGWPILGVIDQCVAGERWVGAMGLGTTFNGASPPSIRKYTSILRWEWSHWSYPQCPISDAGAAIGHPHPISESIYHAEQGRLLSLTPTC